MAIFLKYTPAYPDVVTSDSDPYVVVEDGETTLQVTSVVNNTRNPVWTLSTGSLFLIETNVYDFFAKSAQLKFIVKDSDAIPDDDVIGTVLVNKTDLIKGTGERQDYELALNMDDGKQKDSTWEKKVRDSQTLVPITDE